MAHRDTDHEGTESFSQLVPDWLRIQVTPPSLAAGTLQAAELELLGEQQRRARGGALEDEAITGLAESGWLRQDVQTRGAYLSTSGFRSRLDQPELVMLNVPSAAIGWAAAIFEGMACYLDRDDARFAPGEIYIELGPAGVGAFTFSTLGAEAADSVGFGAIDDELLLVVPLP